MVALVLVDALMQHHAQTSLLPNQPAEAVEGAEAEGGEDKPFVINSLGKKLEGLGV